MEKIKLVLASNKYLYAANEVNAACVGEWYRAEDVDKLIEKNKILEEELIKYRKPYRGAGRR